MSDEGHRAACADNRIDLLAREQLRSRMREIAKNVLDGDRAREGADGGELVSRAVRARLCANVEKGRALRFPLRSSLPLRLVALGLTCGSFGCAVESVAPSDAGTDTPDAAECTAPGTYRVVQRFVGSGDCPPGVDETIEVPIPLETFVFENFHETTVTPIGPCRWAVHGLYDPLEGTTTVDGVVVAVGGRVDGEFEATFVYGEIHCEYVGSWELAPD